MARSTCTGIKSAAPGYKDQANGLLSYQPPKTCATRTSKFNRRAPNKSFSGSSSKPSDSCNVWTPIKQRTVKKGALYTTQGDSQHVYVHVHPHTVTHTQ